MVRRLASKPQPEKGLGFRVIPLQLTCLKGCAVSSLGFMGFAVRGP